VRSKLIKGLYTLRLTVYSSSNKIARIPLNHFFFYNKPKLKLADKFSKDLNKYIIEQEAKSKDKVEEV
jgi:hypothetical protein